MSIKRMSLRFNLDNWPVRRVRNHGCGYDVVELPDYTALYGIPKRSGCRITTSGISSVQFVKKCVKCCDNIFAI